MTRPPFIIAHDKLASYLLNAHHRTGGSKARFFLSHGFVVEAPAAMAGALLDHAEAHWPGSIVPSLWGERHELIGPMQLPDGTRRDVLAVWEIRANETVANFVTAYPQ